MAVKIRLARRGRKRRAIYDIVAADVRAPRDGKFIEKLGIYNPNTNPAIVELDNEKALAWVLKGALPTDTARILLSDKGIMLKKHLQLGVLKGAISQEDADKRFDAWKEQKDSKTAGTADKLQKALEDDKKNKLEAERKVSEARAAELAKKLQAEAAPAEEAEAEGDAEASSEETNAE